MTQHNGEPQPGGGSERDYAFVGDGLQITCSQVTKSDGSRGMTKIQTKLCMSEALF